nr:immunoglobulin heavy chain junction region [Mus musculus]
TVYAYDVWTT